MHKVVTVGIGGFGRSGYGIHANWLKQDTARFKVVAVADGIQERRRDAVDMFGCQVYEDYREMLEKGSFDLFVNATPSRFHVEAGLAGLEQGYHLLQEKPSAKTVKDFDRLVAAAEKTGKVFYPFQNSRFFPFFKKMKEIIDSGVLGEIVYIRSNWSGFSRRWDWQTLQREWGGNLLNTGPHPMDHAVVLFGNEYPDVFCKMYASHPSGGDANNFCVVVLHKKGRPTVEVVLNSFQAYPQGDMYNVSGTLGGLSATPQEVKWKYFDPAAASAPSLHPGWSDNRQYCSEELPWQEMSWVHEDKNSNESGFSEMVAALYENLHDVLTGGGERIIKIEEVRRQIYAIEEAHKQNPDN